MPNLYNGDNNKNLSDRAAVITAIASLPQTVGQEAASARLSAVAAPASCSQQHPINILRLPDVMKRVGLCRASIYQRMGNGTFPKQILLGARAVGWLEHEIDAWLAAIVAVHRNGRV